MSSPRSESYGQTRRRIRYVMFSFMFFIKKKNMFYGFVCSLYCNRTVLLRILFSSVFISSREIICFHIGKTIILLGFDYILEVGFDDFSQIC